MMMLKDILLGFKGSSDEVKLQEMFQELAKSFLYGGFIQVGEDYRVFIKTVEFYYHSEKDEGIHDPIVYHRHTRNSEGKILREVPYFPLMTLHAHNSGFDITFENEAEEYRASALIRAYEVKDKQGHYLIWKKNDEDSRYMFVQEPHYGFNTQSTYLYSILNGFPLGTNNAIRWIDSPREQLYNLIPKLRKNAFKSKNEWKYESSNVKCDRTWSFTREEKVQ